MADHLFFLLGFCLLLTHEMDAIRCKEWRIFPITSRMDSDAGYRAFTAFHVPLFALLLWELFGGERIDARWILGLNIFFMFHAFLHVIFLRHPENLFRSAFSWILIAGAGVCGALDLVLAL